MIRKFISRLFTANKAETNPQNRGQRRDLPRSQHQIDASRLSQNARNTVQTLQQAGFEAYIVGGAVRDLLLGLKPKDFDVATNATPEQVKPLFKRAFIIGRRFRIVHVMYGRDIIEVSTYRALHDAQAAESVDGNERTSRRALADKTLAVDSSGRVLRDNVWGTLDDDAERRDFTINALYYDPIRDVVVDYHRGMKDLKERRLRMIGDPAARYREDPVRMLRIARFAAKLGFDIDPATLAPIGPSADLLANVPAARLFDETIKLLQTGHAVASLQQLRRLGLHHGLLPLLDPVLEKPEGERFITNALQDTDERIAQGKTASPSFLFACLLWHDVEQRWNALLAEGIAPLMALDQAADEVLAAQAERLAIQRRIATDMREIWSLQSRFERRTPRYANSLVEHPRFRAAYDFLSLRARSGQAEPELVQWWEAFQFADAEGRADMLATAPQPSAASKPRRRRRRKKPSEANPADGASNDSSE
ncbi:MAG: polynucleotide adenylyltransferase PcnB [Thiomonas arsenitoxydans]|uniref:Poly(A) polymerase I n=1 Tax=Thiomonas arsenitoxydans (strain DSM 22701 / CIP 110005 / 3As) TaxID=426114 RepID=A0A8I1MTX3_THIA3|nr:MULTISPECIES: polynucleotide adenylyltransferase PcnB [Thiomonas]MBN8743054.1 polynucleotide adenylyltransferase PcnB [Thiomonas arsenitoxydans]ODU98715.1 MAG: poly(A) polymerase [Thiomonas sp. SCN 64-16]